MFTFLHTNDFHNELSATQSNRLRQLRLAVGDSGLLLDAGDAIGAGNITFRPGGEPILETMGESGYDAMTVGNREFHFSRMGFHSKLSRARFPILCANVRRSGKGPPGDVIFNLNSSGADTARQPTASALETSSADPPVLPYIVRDLVPNFRVVILGITVPMITERMLVRKVSAYVFDDPLEKASQLVPRLRTEFAPDLLIVLSHVGIQKDRLLAAGVPGIDLIVGGHTHVVLESGERVGETLIVQAGCRGQYVGTVLAQKKEQKLQLSASLEAL